MIAYHNGRFVPCADATLSFADAGFASGATIVDTCRTYGGKPFRWADHLQRFRRDCADAFIPLVATDAELTAAAQHLIETNGPDVMLVTFATPGLLALYGLGDGPPTVGMMTYPLPVERYRRWIDDGVCLAVVGHLPANPTSVLPPRIKHRSRLAWWVIDRLPRPVGTVAIVTDRPGGTLTETSAANFLAVIDGVLVSPPRDRVLDGISLRVTLELAAGLGIPTGERELPLSVVPRMSEALLTGSGVGLAGVRRIDEWDIPWPGPVFGRLQAAWARAVAAG